MLDDLNQIPVIHQVASNGSHQPTEQRLSKQPQEEPQRKSEVSPFLAGPLARSANFTKAVDIADEDVRFVDISDRDSEEDDEDVQGDVNKNVRFEDISDRDVVEFEEDF